MKKILTPVLFLLVTHLTLQAQSDTTAQKHPAQFKLSLNYNSGLNYYGRTDSLKSSGFFPLAELWFNKNFYVNAAPVFINNSVQSLQYAGTIATVGYQKLSGKWMTNVFILKPFYRQNSQLPQSALKVQSGLNISFLNKIVNINGGADIKYSNQFDLGASAGLDHIIRIENNDNSMFIIDPSVYLYAGTQNFTNTYYQKKGSFLFFPGVDEQVSQNVQKFSILSYECSVPLIYVKGKWQLMITPAYVLPQNLVAIPGHPNQSESGGNTFYTTVTLKHIF